MEKKDYSQFREISISDLPIKFVRRDFLRIFESNGITNLEQLFEAYDNGIFKDGRKTGYQTLKGMIEILKNAYLDEPLIADSCLDLKHIYAEDRKGFENKVWNKLQRLGLTTNEIVILENYYRDNFNIPPLFLNDYNTIESIMCSLQNNQEYQTSFLAESFTRNFRKCNTENNEIINRRTEISKMEIVELQNLNFKMSVLLEHHNKKKDRYQSHDEIIANLKKDLISLTRIKNGLDFQIEMLEGQIESLNDSKGMKK